MRCERNAGTEEDYHQPCSVPTSLPIGFPGKEEREKERERGERAKKDPKRKNEESAVRPASLWNSGFLWKRTLSSLNVVFSFQIHMWIISIPMGCFKKSAIATNSPRSVAGHFEGFLLYMQTIGKLLESSRSPWERSTREFKRVETVVK